MSRTLEFKAANSARMKARHADPEFKAANSARMKARNADPEFKAALKARRVGVDVKIPKWVTEEFWDEYLETAASVGEELAASRIRRLKAGDFA